ncbi:MAG: calcium-translocating P-type ATPase, SERCA-type [Spirochaetia bacterium]
MAESSIIKKPASLSIDEAADRTGTDIERGLTREEAQNRLEKYGTNELKEERGNTILDLIIQQFKSFLVIILVGATVVSFLIGETVDAIAIIAIVILNTIMGVVQEARAEKALAALKKMSSPDASILRDGKHITVSSTELVPGDIVFLEAGNYVPADIRLTESVNLNVNESSLTGESVPEDKKADAVLEDDTDLGDQKNCVFMNTMISSGRGSGIVVRTGMETEMGKIADMIQSYEKEQTPLQKNLDQLGRRLGILALAICVVILIFGVIRYTDVNILFGDGISPYFREFQDRIVELFMTAVSLAIAAVPEGLPAVVTICLALGMRRMVKRNALIRRLPAVETLGNASVICTDKTGTLTQNQMTVQKGWVSGRLFSVTGEGYKPEGEFKEDGEVFRPDENKAVSLLLRGGLLCNDANLEEDTDSEENGWNIIGDPTEGSLIVSAAKAGLNKSEENKKWKRVREFAFNSERKRMTTIHEIPADFDRSGLPGVDTEYVAFVKGAPDVVLEYSGKVLKDGKVTDMTGEDRDAVIRVNEELADQALRVLAVAYRPVRDIPEEEADPETVENDLIYIGLQGMIDPARPEVKDAVESARQAGIRTIMVTGDYKITAAAIGKAIGILRPEGKVLSGKEIDKLNEEEMAQAVKETDVFARVSPEHKVRIVDALRAAGSVSAMTGDGVNDAPALKRADIGVAMGITGTDVSKETAEMVLTDDNFASIVSAVEEGRTIYANIRKFVFYLLSCNIGEILTILGSMVAGIPIPLTPIQILWVNLVTDGAPALALSVEEGEPDIMKRKPRKRNESVINSEMLAGFAVQGIVIAASVIIAFLLGRSFYSGSISHARSIAFATLVTAQIIRGFTVRSQYHSIFSIGFFSNKYMVMAILSSIVLLLAVVYIPFLNGVFNTTPLTPRDWLVILSFGLAAPIAEEITKVFIRMKRKK